MDDLVKQAMAKWPNVPDCYGWLGLDERGHWYLRDDAAQASGSFQSGAQGAKGSLLRHDKLIEFIHRNYARDAQGAWYFQNGPQRVYVELASTPLVWRLSDDFQLSAHTGQETTASACYTDQEGRVYFNTPLGFGLLHTLDVGKAAEGLEQAYWQLETVKVENLQTQFDFRQSPAQDKKKPL
jgi:hypothetical protein